MLAYPSAARHDEPNEILILKRRLALPGAIHQTLIDEWQGKVAIELRQNEVSSTSQDPRSFMEDGILVPLGDRAQNIEK